MLSRRRVFGFLAASPVIIGAKSATRSGNTKVEKMSLVPDFGRTFFDHSGGGNEVRMPIDSRVIITDPSSAQHTFYGIREHFAENTAVQTGMFKNPSFDFRPVLSANEGCLFFRRYAEFDPLVNPYKQYTSTSPWNTGIPIVPEVEATQVTTYDEIRTASHAGKPLVGRVELPVENGYSAVIEHPVNSISLYPETPRWQVNAGPVPFPRFDEVSANLIEDLDIAFVTYNRFDYCEFLMENSHDLGDGKKRIHFNTYFSRPAAISLWAVG